MTGVQTCALPICLRCQTSGEVWFVLHINNVSNIIHENEFDMIRRWGASLKK